MVLTCGYPFDEEVGVVVPKSDRHVLQLQIRGRRTGSLRPTFEVMVGDGGEEGGGVGEQHNLPTQF